MRKLMASAVLATILLCAAPHPASAGLYPNVKGCVAYMMMRFRADVSTGPEIGPDVVGAYRHYAQLRCLDAAKH
ncbi:MAG: hypothetical protein JWM47_1361 [Acidimicrobiales bacterium]|nr:hypothetical protein [Acidimicrobiales bacterium]